MKAESSSTEGAADEPHWVCSWAASVQGPYPVGNASAQPDLSRAFPNPENGAKDQSFRLIVRPTLWGRAARVRLSNALGSRPVTFAGVHLGLLSSGAELAANTNQAIRFGGAATVTVAPGLSVWSDAVDLPFVRDAAASELTGRKLAVSFHVVGTSGPMTWHAKALQSSYISWPGAGARGHEESEASFPFATTSWYFLDALDMAADPEAYAIVAFGDSITDGTASTLNGDDRWPDVLARRLRAKYGNRIAVVNAGIGGNQVRGPLEYSIANPVPGGPSALARLERDVLSLSSVQAVIWLEGTNDFSSNGNASVAAVQQGLAESVAQLRTSLPGVRVLGATLISALGATTDAHGFKEQDDKRRQLNDFIRHAAVFDGVIDFDQALTDPISGEMRAEFVPDNTVGGPGDKLHPNRLGYQAMGALVDLDLLALGR